MTCAALGTGQQTVSSIVVRHGPPDLRVTFLNRLQSRARGMRRKQNHHDLNRSPAVITNKLHKLHQLTWIQCPCRWC